jgi:hypothetical protein
MFDTQGCRFWVTCIRASRSYASVHRRYCHTRAAPFLQHPRVERHGKQLGDLSPSRTSWFSNSRIRGIHLSPGMRQSSISFFRGRRDNLVSSALQHGGINRPEPGTGYTSSTFVDACMTDAARLESNSISRIRRVHYLRRWKLMRGMTYCRLLMSMTSTWRVCGL